MSKSAGGQKENHNADMNQQTSVDPQTMAWMQEVMNAARNAGTAGPSPLATGAADYNTATMGAGRQGVAALSGDAAAQAALMDPYQSQVIDANNAQWDNADAHTASQMNDAATKANAFGGSRHGVATGVALGENNRNRMGQTAGLLSGGFQNSMGRAAQLAGMGAQGAGANANLGMGGVGSPQQWLMQMLNQGFRQTGSSTTGSSSGGSSTLGTQSAFRVPFFG
jgi:hypothetical protein